MKRTFRLAVTCALVATGCALVITAAFEAWEPLGWLCAGWTILGAGLLVCPHAGWGGKA